MAEDQRIMKRTQDAVALEEGEIIDTDAQSSSEPAAKRANIAAHDTSKDVSATRSSMKTEDLEALNSLNPPVIVLPSTAIKPDGQKITVQVIREDVLPGGTKQRATALLFNDHDDTYVYAGPVFGFAQLALSVCTRKFGKRATVIVARQRSGQLHPLTARAQRWGAHVVERGYPNRLKDIQAFSKDYVRDRRRTYLLPFGLDCEAFKQGLIDQLKKALPRHLLTNPPRRLWLVAGSATLLAAFARMWPRTTFLAVQVGKKIWPDQLGVREDGSKAFEAKLYIAEENFWDRARRQPPYPSVPSYDAKLWQFVEQFGEDGDFVWNVAGEDQTYLTEAEAKQAQEFREHGGNSGCRLVAEDDVHSQ